IRDASSPSTPGAAPPRCRRASRRPWRGSSEMRLWGTSGQPRAVLALTRGFASGRFQPSLIFHGPPGAGKLTTAVTLARALLCGAGGDTPCGACAACRRVDDRSARHPDLRVVFPEKMDDFKKGEVAEEGVSGIDLQERQAAAM